MMIMNPKEKEILRAWNDAIKIAEIWGRPRLVSHSGFRRTPSRR
jgi:hypothetical protein